MNFQAIGVAKENGEVEAGGICARELPKSDGPNPTREHP